MFLAPQTVDLLPSQNVVNSSKYCINIFDGNRFSKTRKAMILTRLFLMMHSTISLLLVSFGLSSPTNTSFFALISRKAKSTLFLLNLDVELDDVEEDEGVEDGDGVDKNDNADGTKQL